MASVQCLPEVQYMGASGLVQRTVKTKSKASVRLARDARDGSLAVTVAVAGSDHSFSSKGGIAVHRKFAAEGRATLRFPQHRAQLLIARADPEALADFLDVLDGKLYEASQSHSAPVKRKRPVLSENATLSEMYAMAERNSQPAVLASVSPPSGKRPRLAEITNSAHGSRGSCAQRLALVDTDGMNEEQRRVLELVCRGKSVFFTGSAGTGKSFLLQKIRNALPEATTFFTASTGVAACHINGTTLHTFAGIGSDSKGKLPKKTRQWLLARTLVIDEISMVDPDYFDQLDQVAKRIRRNDLPFGGIQLVLVGDFLQLPPVTKGSTPKRFCFEASCWKECRLTTVELKQIYRQKESAFTSILQRIRFGECTDDDEDLLRSTENNKIEINGVLATKLCTHIRQAETINQTQLDRLDTEMKVYRAHDSDPSATSRLNSWCPAPQTLQLKEGAQVMLIKNLRVSHKLVNGARGVVQGFNPQGFPVVRFASGREECVRPESWTLVGQRGAVVASRKQIPLKLAWAISVHKSQGMSLDCVEIDLSSVFEDGQAYVALSRARSLATLRVRNFTASCVKASDKVIQFYQSLRNRRPAALAL
eukprot:m.55038 g.55038  ORF g.55038 m.55038 type:complete len:593 (-) comp6896_c0_seq2:61-1839(-)